MFSTNFVLYFFFYFIFQISTNAMKIHVRTEVFEIITRDLSLVRVLLDGRGKCVESGSLSLKRNGWSLPISLESFKFVQIKIFVNSDCPFFFFFAFLRGRNFVDMLVTVLAAKDNCF